MSNPRVAKVPHLVYHAANHRQKVKSLYKSYLKMAKEYLLPDFFAYREEAIKLRLKFEANKNMKDFRKVKETMELAERILKNNKHPKPIYYPYSPGGVCYDREPCVDDVMLDRWHPLEKAQYPYYFAKREKLKEEYIELFKKQYGDLNQWIEMPKPEPPVKIPEEAYKDYK